MTLNSSTNSKSMPMTFQIKPNSSCPHGTDVEASVHFLIDRMKWGLCCSSSVQHFRFCGSLATVKGAKEFSQHVWRPTKSLPAAEHRIRNQRCKIQYPRHPWVSKQLPQVNYRPTELERRFSIIGSTTRAYKMRSYNAKEVLSPESLLWAVPLPCRSLIVILNFKPSLMHRKYQLSLLALGV